MSVPAGADFYAQLAKGPEDALAREWERERKGGLFHPLTRGKVRSSDMGGGLLGWWEEGLKVEGRGLGWKCQMVHRCVSSDGGEHPAMAPTF